jgi:hypothetical protein
MADYPVQDLTEDPPETASPEPIPSQDLAAGGGGETVYVPVPVGDLGDL